MRRADEAIASLHNEHDLKRLAELSRLLRLSADRVVRLNLDLEDMDKRVRAAQARERAAGQRLQAVAYHLSRWLNGSTMVSQRRWVASLFPSKGGDPSEPKWCMSCGAMLPDDTLINLMHGQPPRKEVRGETPPRPCHEPLADSLAASSSGTNGRRSQPVRSAHTEERPHRGARASEAGRCRWRRPGRHFRLL
jgi:hypothetical protein